MSLTMAKAEGVTVLTLTSDPESPCPPLCQIIGGLCYNPVCYAVSERLRRVQGTSQTLLGALHVIVGLLNIGLGGVFDFRSSPYPFWLGAMFILFGIVSILSEKYPSPCLVILSVILNLCAVGFAIAAIILYSLDIALNNLWWMCEDDFDDYNTPSPHEDIIKVKCNEGKALILMLVKGLLSVLIVLSVLEFCVAISSAVLGIKALKSREKRGNKSTDDPEHYRPLQEEVISSPPA